jgi:hypothetical protein
MRQAGARIWSAHCVKMKAIMHYIIRRMLSAVNIMNGIRTAVLTMLRTNCLKWHILHRHALTCMRHACAPASSLLLQPPKL